jgi:hypothetical protein
LGTGDGGGTGLGRGRERERMGRMNFEKYFYFDGENMPNSARYYTDDKSKLLGDDSFIKKK